MKSPRYLGTALAIAALAACTDSITPLPEVGITAAPHFSHAGDGAGTVVEADGDGGTIGGGTVTSDGGADDPASGASGGGEDSSERGGFTMGSGN